LHRSSRIFGRPWPRTIRFKQPSGGDSSGTNGVTKRRRIEVEFSIHFIDLRKNMEAMIPAVFVTEAIQSRFRK
jgi:hypothetical protein